MTDQDPKIIVTFPSNEKIVKLINVTAKFVAADGEAFEQVMSVCVCVYVCMNIFMYSWICLYVYVHVTSALCLLIVFLVHPLRKSLNLKHIWD